MKSLMTATALTTFKKVAFTLLCCTVLIVFAAPDRATAQTQDQCSAPTAAPAVGTGAVGSATGPSTCGVVITIPASGPATIATPGNGNPYDGTEDTLVGIINESSASLDSITLTSSTTAIFGFDNDGPCDPLYNAHPYSWCSTAGFTGYEGPDNTFTNITNSAMTGTVVFTIPIPPGKSTWFALEGQPSDLTGASETSIAVTQTGTTITPTTLSQQFVFNSMTGNHVEFDFDYTTAFNGDSLTINPGTVPSVSNLGVTGATYATMVAGTSLATTTPYFAAGEGTDASNSPLAPLLTLECVDNTNPTPAGDNCPESPTERNNLYTNNLDGAGVISVPPNTMLTLAEFPDTCTGSAGGPGCSFVGPETGRLVPQNLVTNFQATSLDCTGCKTGGTGSFSNSGFIAGGYEPEWMTTPTVALWSNSTTVPVSFTANPPTPPSLPDNGWVAAPNQSITWGEEALGATPDTTFPVATDTTVSNGTACPTAWPPHGTTPPSFTAGGNVSASGEGAFEVHFFSTACDDQEELVFAAPIAPATNYLHFKTAPFNVDLTKPTITTPVLSVGLGNNVLALNSGATASFTCTDPTSNGVFSGIAGCGAKVTPSGTVSGLPQVKPVTGYPVPTSSAGPQTLTVYATDEAGNTSSPGVVAYNVGYCITSTDNAGNLGFTAPVLNPGPNLASPNVNSASVSQTIPLQITVTYCNGQPVTGLTFASVTLTAANSTYCTVHDTDNTISTAAAGNSGWQNLGLGVYQYNWKPLPPKGACLSFSMNLGDGVQHTAYFSFK
jgi:hypothetical protein